MLHRPTLRQQIDTLLTTHASSIRLAFLASIQEITSRITLRRIVESLERDDVIGAISALNLERAAFARFEDAVALAYGAGGIATAEKFPALRNRGGAKLVIRFNVRNLRAEQWLLNNSSMLVTRIIEDQVIGLQTALVAGMRAGRNPNSVALDIVGRINRATGRRTGGLIGLTTRQSEYVQSARDELLSGDTALLRNYLARSRRDKRFDRTILKAIESETPLNAALVNRIAGRYSDKLLQLRGETIARTEALTSIHAGKREGFRQGLDKTNYPPEAVTRVWRSAGDGKVRHTHSAMNGQEVQGLDTPFTSPSGGRLLYPGDTSLGAGAQEVINCRCDDDYRIDFSFGVD